LYTGRSIRSGIPISKTIAEKRRKRKSFTKRDQRHARSARFVRIFTVDRWGIGRMAEARRLELLGFMLSNSTSMRAEQYRRDAIKFRALAAAQADYDLRCQLLELAQGYDELATSCADRR
jgi:hypothetical protein